MRGILATIALLAACSTAAPDPVPDPPIGAPAEASPSDPTPALAQHDDPPPQPPVAGAHPEPAQDAPPAVEPTPAALPFDAVASKLRALIPDPAPERTTNDTHYLVSNERRHDLFAPELNELGGVMLGVGSDQSYVMAPWAKTELLVIVDFDDKIVDLHAIHGALMGAAPTVEEFRRLWSEDGADDARAVIRAAADEPARREVLLALYDEARATVDKRLRKLDRRYRELEVHSYLDTPEQYRYVADLHARGRVVALRGDFTRGGVLQNVAAVLAEHELPLRILYLSNIEQYFSYRKPFKDNMLALPFDGQTLVLRTLPGRPAGFHYILQAGDDFHAWMRAPKVWSVYTIRGFVKGEPLEANKRFTAGPPPASK